MIASPMIAKGASSTESTLSLRPVKVRLRGAFFALMVAIAGMGGVAFKSVSELDEVVNSLSVDWISGQSQARDIERSLLQYQAAVFQRLAVASDHGASPDDVRILADGLRGVHHALGSYEVTLAGVRDREAFRRVASAIEPVLAALQSAVAAGPAGGQREAALRALGDEQPLRRDLAAALAGLVRVNDDGASAVVARALALTGGGRVGILAGLGGLCLLFVLCAGMVENAIGRMARGQKRLLQALAANKRNVDAVVADLGGVAAALAQGDLTRKIEQGAQGDLLKLKDDINTTVDKLAGVVNRIGLSVTAIFGNAAQVATVGSDLSERSEQQAASLEQTAAALVELGAAVKASADNAAAANHLAGEVRESGTHGSSVATSALVAMKRIAQATHKITDIIDVIDEIAFHTNLLSLNAAVEAARAGEAGRGFAVVAQEVRLLARRSAEASKEIKGLIMHSDAEVTSGVTMVKGAAEALAGMVRSVEKIAMMVEEVAFASREQSQALQEINLAVSHMDDVTQRNAALAESGSAAAQSMHLEAENLSALMSFFLTDRQQADGSLNRSIALIEATKIDHQNFMETIDAAIGGQASLDPAKVTDHHGCRLGQWYDSVRVPEIRDNAAFRALEPPHAAVHEAGRRALRLHLAGDVAACRGALSEMNAASAGVMEQIDALAADLRIAEARRRGVSATHPHPPEPRPPTRTRAAERPKAASPVKSQARTTGPLSHSHSDKDSDKNWREF
jgi:methyl-accepting chemotaxis protein